MITEASNETRRNTLQIWMAGLAGILGSFLWGNISAHTVADLQNEPISWAIFYVIYSSLALFLITFIGTRSPLILATIFMLMNYFSGYAFVTFWGQLGPFDLIPMSIYTLPSLCVAYVTFFLLKRRSGDGTPSPFNI